MPLDLPTLRARAEAALRRAEAASPGPWSWEAADASLLYLNGPDGALVLACDRCPACETADTRCFWPEKADSDFLTAARTDVPDLARAVLALTERLAAAEARLADMEGASDA